MPLPEVLLFTRAGCHLCEEAEQLLTSFGLQPRAIDIDADPVLRQRYDVCVPVVSIAGRERFRGRINAVLLRRVLQGLHHEEASKAPAPTPPTDESAP